MMAHHNKSITENVQYRLFTRCPHQHKGAPAATWSSDLGVEKLISLSFCVQNDINNKLGLI